MEAPKKRMQPQLGGQVTSLFMRGVASGLALHLRQDELSDRKRRRRQQQPNWQLKSLCMNVGNGQTLHPRHENPPPRTRPGSAAKLASSPAQELQLPRPGFLLNA